MACEVLADDGIGRRDLRDCLLRHLPWLLPSSQSIARALHVPALSRPDLRDLRGFGFGPDESAPL